MKTQPMEHQKEAQKRMDANPTNYALACEQGTGKTWMLLNDIERQFMGQRINAAFILAPKGVHSNWIRREIPKHCSIPVTGTAWVSGMGKRAKEKFEQFMTAEVDGLKVLAMNIDAVNTEAGYKAAARFLRAHRCYFAVDESSRIKTPNAQRTKKVIKLGSLAVSRRIASGTMVTNGPIDLFSQFEFLKPGLLGTTSYRVFVAEFAKVLPPQHGLMQHVQKRNRSGQQPQIIEKDSRGRPIWRNLDKLNAMLAPMMYRVKKSDCLDLPEKIYQTISFNLTPKQQRAYELMRDECRLLLADGDVQTVKALAALNKLRQITSGFVMVDGVATSMDEAGPRLAALMELVADLDGQFIVWAYYREELRQVSEALAKAGLKVVQYHGGVNNTDREHAVDAFQRGEVDVFVGQPQSGGIGLTLTNASTVIYYSNDFSLENRLQSEDRAHRIGTEKHVVYYDILAEDTIDEKIVDALQSKQDVANAIIDGEF